MPKSELYAAESERGEPIPESELSEVENSIASDSSQKKDLQKKVEGSKQTATTNQVT